VLVLLSLCKWQLDRHTFKNRHVPLAVAAQALPVLEGDSLSGESLEGELYRHVRLSGRFVGEPLLEGGRQLGRRPGYALLQTFQSSQGLLLLVDRGELLLADRTEALKRVEALEALSVDGQLRPLPESSLRSAVSTAEGPLIWPRNSLAGIHGHAAGSHDIVPGVYLRAGPLLQEGESSEEGELLSTGYRAPKTRYDSLHYAKQWFAMALILVALWAGAGFVRGRREAA